MKLIPEDFKRLFGKRAAVALNALAHWVNNFAYGFGIKVNREGGQVNVAIDTESESLQEWIRETANKADTSTPSELEEPEDLDDAEDNFFYLFTDKWESGKYTPASGTAVEDVGITFKICTGGKIRSDGAKVSLKFREITINRYGRVVKVGQEVGGYTIEDT